MISILVASKEGKPPGGLEYAGPYTLIIKDTPGWANAANEALEYAVNVGHDALFLDDDTTLTADSLTGVREYYDKADIFGLDLHIPDRGRQGGARHIFAPDGSLHEWNHPGPAYVAHCSTSAIYIKARVLQAGVRFPVWPGVHWEDVAFCVECWLRGFPVLAVPGRVWHNLTIQGVGQTKIHDDQLWARIGENARQFGEWAQAREVGAALAAGTVPTGAVEL